MGELARYKRAAVVAWTVALIGCTIADVQRKEEEMMRSINVSIELTDAEYKAVEWKAKEEEKARPATFRFWDANTEIAFLAQFFVHKKAHDYLNECMEAYGQIGEVDLDAARQNAAVDDSDLSVSSADGMFPGQVPAAVTPEAAPEPDPHTDRLTRSGGVFHGPSGKETWYNLPMDGVVDIMRASGYPEWIYPYWEREDGCKMLGQFIMAAASLDIRPRGTILDTSLGEAIVCDTGTFAMSDQTQIDIAVNW